MLIVQCLVTERNIPLKLARTSDIVEQEEWVHLGTYESIGVYQ